jgi:DUF4097 and DUF4098 domain-containing protein YvlB
MRTIILTILTLPIFAMATGTESLIGTSPLFTDSLTEQTIQTNCLPSNSNKIVLAPRKIRMKKGTVHDELAIDSLQINYSNGTYKFINLKGRFGQLRLINGYRKLSIDVDSDACVTSLEIKARTRFSSTPSSMKRIVLDVWAQ